MVTVSPLSGMPDAGFVPPYQGEAASLASFFQLPSRWDVHVFAIISPQ